MVNAVLVEKEQSEEKSDQFEKKIEITKPETETEKSVKKQVAKRFGSKVNINETMDKVEIIIELIGHKFNAEHLDVQVSMEMFYWSKPRMVTKNLNENSPCLRMLMWKKLNQNLLTRLKRSRS